MSGEKYLLFAGDDYYPVGGWSDFVGEFASMDDARAVVESGRTETTVQPRVTTYGPPAASGLVTSTSGRDEPPFTPVQGASFGNGEIIAVRDDGYFDVAYPGRTDVSYRCDWAQVVHGGEVVASFHAGSWDDA